LSDRRGRLAKICSAHPERFSSTTSGEINPGGTGLSEFLWKNSKNGDNDRRKRQRMVTVTHLE